MLRFLAKLKVTDPCRTILLGNKNENSLLKSYATSAQFPEYADVVIIGGGSAGCNALYYLTKLGAKAVLIEKSKLTSGTTWHSAGLIWNLRPNDVEIELLNGTLKTFARLEKETDENPGWRNNGGLYIARSEIRLDEYKRLVTIGKAFGIESHVISPGEARELFPLMDEGTVTGAMYTPGDGTVDPTSFIMSLAKSAKKDGAKIYEDCPVTKIITTKSNYESKQQVSGVVTPLGMIKTNRIINASGVWSKNIAKMIGLDIPLVPMKHAYIVTETIDGVQGCPNIRDHDGTIYLKAHGDSMSLGGYERNPIVLKNVPDDFSFKLYELDWNVFESNFTATAELAPRLSTAGIKSTVCGPESFTPDHKPIMGEDPRCNGFFYSCGYNSAGMMLGGGCGEQIAKWVMDGRPDKHMFRYDIRRFTADQTKDAIWANERSHEAYAKNYSIVFPNDQPLSGRNFKLSPFHDALINQGAVMEERQGWERPGWYLPEGTVQVLPYDYQGSYGSSKNEQDLYTEILKKDYTFDFPEHQNIIREEVLACRNNAALFDLSYFGKFYLCGPEVEKAADQLFVSDTKRPLNRTVYTAMLNKRGCVEADCTVTTIEAGSSGVVDPIFKGNALYVVAGGGSAYHTWCHIKQVIADNNYDVSLHKATDQIGILSIQGPNSRKILQSLINDDLSNDAFPFSTSRLVKLKGCTVRVFRLTFVGELGYELHIPAQHCMTVYNMLLDSGKSYNFKHAGYRALYSLSAEKGYHLWDMDLRADDNPIEAGLGFVCRKNADYIGSDVVNDCLRDGIKKKLVHFELEAQVPLWGLETVYRNGEIVGYIRRGDYAHTSGRSIGRAYIRHPNGDNATKEFLQSGEYEIEIMGKKYPAAAYLHSPFDPKNKRIQGEYDNL